MSEFSPSSFYLPTVGQPLPATVEELAARVAVRADLNRVHPLISARDVFLSALYRTYSAHLDGVYDPRTAPTQREQCRRDADHAHVLWRALLDDYGTTTR